MGTKSSAQKSTLTICTKRSAGSKSTKLISTAGVPFKTASGVKPYISKLERKKNQTIKHQHTLADILLFCHKTLQQKERNVFTILGLLNVLTPNAMFIYFLIAETLTEKLLELLLFSIFPACIKGLRYCPRKLY